MVFCCLPRGGRSAQPGTPSRARSQNFQGSGEEVELGLWRPNQKVRVALLGLDDSGKSSLLHSLQQEHSALSRRQGDRDEGETRLCAPPPTTEARTAIVSLAGLKVTVTDCPGRKAFREAWLDVVGESDAIAFAVDSNDAMRMPVAGVELGRVIFRAEASGTPVLVLATKQDLAGAVPPGDLGAALGLAQGAAQVVGCTATNPAGVREAMEGFLAGRTAR